MNPKNIVLPTMKNVVGFKNSVVPNSSITTIHPPPVKYATTQTRMVPLSLQISTTPQCNVVYVVLIFIIFIIVLIYYYCKNTKSQKTYDL